MRAANKTLLALTILAAASTACRQSSPEQNVALDNAASATTDIEALPPDESVATPTEELANGGDDASNLGGPANAY